MHHKRQAGSVNVVLLVIIFVVIVGGYLLVTNTNQTASNVDGASAQLASNVSSTTADYSPSKYSSKSTPYYSPTAGNVSSQCISAEQASANIGSTKCVEFLVGSTYTSSRGQMYLNQYTHYSLGFSVWIPAGNTFGPSVLLRYSGKKIDVTGTISSYKGSSEVVVTSETQLSLAP